jgi:protein TonB
MSSKHSSLISLLLVAGVHLGALAAIVLSAPEPAPVEIVQPTIQGVIVMAEPEPTPPPPEPLPPPPPPEKKPEPTPKPKPKPLPKALPSERAVKAPEPEPLPTPPVAQPAEPKPAAPAPVVPPRADAGQISNPAPAYPSLSRRLREEGLVVLEILIRADGSVGEIKLKASSSFKRLDEAAINAVKRWRYQPATQGGQAIDFWYEQPLEFNLH